MCEGRDIVVPNVLIVNIALLSDVVTVQWVFFGAIVIVRVVRLLVVAVSCEGCLVHARNVVESLAVRHR